MAVAVPSREEGAVIPSLVTAAEAAALRADDVLAGWAAECQACRRTKRRGAAVPEGVEAAARNGNLTLTGTVKYPSQRAAAESAVGGVTGVRKTEVPVDDSRMVTNISGNTITLIGHVRTEAQWDAVVRAAWRGHHVMAVIAALIR